MFSILTLSFAFLCWLFTSIRFLQKEGMQLHPFNLAYWSKADTFYANKFHCKKRNSSSKRYILILLLYATPRRVMQLCHRKNITKLPRGGHFAANYHYTDARIKGWFKHYFIHKSHTTDIQSSANRI